MTGKSMDWCREAVVYIASSRQFVEEAVASASSVRSWMPDITIYLQVAPGVDVLPAERSLFTTVCIYSSPQFSYIDKAKFLDGVSEEYVLFLDGDTYVAGALAEGFEILHRFDLAAAHAPGRITGCDLSDPWSDGTFCPWERHC